MSTLYHALANEKAKAVFRVFDHVTIYLLIAGTYTPYTLACLGGAFGWTLFGIVWAAAIVGIGFSSISLRRFQKLSMICYIAMGWVILIAIKPLWQVIGTLPKVEEQGFKWVDVDDGFKIDGVAIKSNIILIPEMESLETLMKKLGVM